MRSLLILCPYLLIPLFTALFIRQFNKPKGITYLITIFLLLLFPYLVVQKDNFNYPPAPGPRHDTGQQFFLIAGYLVMLPLGVLIQFVMNLFVFAKYQSKDIDYPKSNI